MKEFDDKMIAGMPLFMQPDFIKMLGLSDEKILNTVPPVIAERVLGDRYTGDASKLIISN
jgi:hypothetical protein